jgi:Subtilase family
VLLAGVLVLVLAAVGGAAVALAATAPPHAPTMNESTRPTSCAPLPAKQTGADNEPRTVTGTFPWPKPATGSDAENYASYLHTPDVQPPDVPSNWAEGDGSWLLTSARSTNPLLYENPQELCGVEGNSVDQAWQVSTGRPTTVIAITDSGIEWCDPGIVDKIYVNRGAVPPPENAQGLTKVQLEHRGVHFTDSDPYDLNDDGVFNIQDYANDPRIEKPYFCANKNNQDGFGYSGISPMDLIRTFGTRGSKYFYGRQSPAGFTEAISGWNFLDNDNNPYDDVHYDHGTGEAEDSNGAADTLNQEVGTCPSCMVMPIRVGESFIAQSDAFAQGVMFAVDSGASVIQEALGTIDITTTARQATDYAFEHGVPIVASAADEEAEHHNLPAVLPHMLVVNSTTQATSENGVSIEQPPSYLLLNGCTNYGANVDVTVESASCSSEATGKTGGIVGLIESEADNLVAEHKLSPYPGLKTASGAPVALSPNEVQQLVTMNADTIDFQTAALPFGPANNNTIVAPWPTTRYPSQPSYDMYTGYGRMDAGKILHALASGNIPPEAQINSPDWFQTLSPGGTLKVTGLTAAVRAQSYKWELEVGVGTSPEPNQWYLLSSGSGTAPHSGVLASVPLSEIAAIFPAGSSFTGGPVGSAGSADADKFSFTLRLVVKDNRGLIGMDRRTDFLHSDPTLLPGFPKNYGASVDAAPTFAPIGPHGQDVLLVATADGTIYAYRSNGKELRGWPVHTVADPVHLGEHAYTSHQVTSIPHGAIIGGLAVGDLANAKGHSDDVVASDWTGRVYAWNAKGKMLKGFPVRTIAAYSEPAARGPHDRLQRSIVGAPALAGLQGNGKLDIVASAMDRHVYAWQPNGKAVPGWPVLVVDHSEVQSINPVTNSVTFKPGSGVGQGTPLIDTPAIGALNGSGRPDVVVGADEEYSETPNVSASDPDSFALGAVPLLSPGNSRVYAIAPTGNRTSGGPFLKGWPVSIADFDIGLLPDVGDGTTSSPALADISGNGQLETGVITTAGPGYVLKPNGTSYIGTGADGKPEVTSDLVPGTLADSKDVPSIPSVGGAIFAPLGGDSPGISLIAPASSAGKALDAALPGEQGLNDNQIDAWNATTGQFDTAFPQVVNDLEFLVQPTADDLGPDSTPYVVSGTGTYDIRAIDASGDEAPGFPKFTGGWMVNAPAFAPFGTLADQALAAGTREGELFAWSTQRPACASSGPWPKMHHDLWNTNNLSESGAPTPKCASG